MLSTGLECFLQGWNAVDSVGKHLYKVGMLSTVFKNICTALGWFVQCWNAFCRVGMLSTGLECFRQSWNAFDRVGIPLYMVGMLST
jgi:hypothetical protein